MAIVPAIKSSIEHAPFWLGNALARVPYAWRGRIGRVYADRSTELLWFPHLNQEQQQKFIFDRMKTIVTNAYESVPFYHRLYQKHGLTPAELRSFEDLKRIPIVRREDLQECPLEERSATVRGRYLVNTGGSSGQPFGLYILPASMGHEWAHMHRVWASLGYTQDDLKLVFAGRSAASNLVQYDALRHHFAVNVYAPHEDVARALRALLKHRIVRYLHGYPSALYDFASYCAKADQELASILRTQLRGAFLGSEYPAPIYRQKIEAVFGCRTVSWYGHTERAILAWEQEGPLRYTPFQTYGFAEAIPDAQGLRTRLVGTSYYNTASPLIRYDTGDGIDVVSEQAGILREFRIADGRQGEFVVDANGKNISLTALVFGRHHRIFEHARFVQVQQAAHGCITFYVVGADAQSRRNLSEYFDLTGVALTPTFRLSEGLFTTSSGKVPLLVAIDGENDVLMPQGAAHGIRP